jgi:transcriptional regulator with XRE-family HTH domain
MTHTAFNQRLQQRRKAQCLTQQQVADQLFVSRKTVSSWETGRNLPDLFMTQRLAAIYQTSVDDLLDTAAQSMMRPVTMLGPALAIMTIGRLAMPAFPAMLLLSDAFLLGLVVLLVGWWRRRLPVPVLRGGALLLSISLVSAAWNNLFAMDFGLQLVYLLTAVVLIIPVATAGGTWYRRQRNQQVRG